jgi:thiol:disulfide interchange protein
MRLAFASLVSLLPLALMAAPLYPEASRAAADIDAAVQQAASEHKRVLVDFGGDWCPDCKILDINFKRPENAGLLKSRYVVVRVNVGDRGIQQNFEIAERYGIPLKKGVPALAVLDATGKMVYAQSNGEFESMRSMDPKSVNDFLRRWAE